MATCDIYVIRHTATGRCYVGSSVDVAQRWASHRSLLRRSEHHSRRLQRAWSKYGEGAFEFEVVASCDVDERAAREQAEIDARSAYASGFNGRPIAEHSAGFRHSEESRRKISQVTRGRRLSGVHRKAISEALKGNQNGLGVKKSEEARRRQSERLAGNTYALGKKMPASFSEKLSERNKGNTYGSAQKGKPKSAAHRAACSEGQRRRWARYRAEKEATACL